MKAVLPRNDPSIGIEWPQLVGEYPGNADPSGYKLEDGTPLNFSKKILSGILLRIHLNSNNYH